MQGPIPSAPRDPPAPPLFEGGAIPDLASLQDLWSDGVALCLGGILVLALGVWCLFSGLGAGPVVGAALVVVATVFLGWGAYEFRALRQARVAGRLRGLDLRPELSLIPIVRRTVRVPLGQEAAIETVLGALRQAEVLTNGEIRLSGVKRHGEAVVAYTGPSAGLLLAASAFGAPWMPSTIRVAARGQGGFTDLDVTIWPYTRVQGEGLADAVLDAIRAGTERRNG